MEQNLALFCILLSVLPLPLLLASLDRSASVLERLWPGSKADAFSKPRFIHDHASVDADTSLPLVDLEQQGELWVFVLAHNEKLTVVGVNVQVPIAILATGLPKDLWE